MNGTFVLKMKEVNISLPAGGGMTQGLVACFGRNRHHEKIHTGSNSEKLIPGFESSFLASVPTQGTLQEEEGLLLHTRYLSLHSHFILSWWRRICFLKKGILLLGQLML